MVETDPKNTLCMQACVFFSEQQICAVNSIVTGLDESRSVPQKEIKISSQPSNFNTIKNVFVYFLQLLKPVPTNKNS